MMQLFELGMAAVCGTYHLHGALPRLLQYLRDDRWQFYAVPRQNLYHYPFN